MNPPEMLLQRISSSPYYTQRFELIGEEGEGLVSTFIAQLMNDQNALFAESHLSVFFKLSLLWLEHCLRLGGLKNIQW